MSASSESFSEQHMSSFFVAALLVSSWDFSFGAQIGPASFGSYSSYSESKLERRLSGAFQLMESIISDFEM